MKSLNNQELQEIVDEIPIVILDNLRCYISNLREENWKLEKTYKRYNTMYNKLKSRIDKAIEYINSAIENDDIEELRSARHLLLYNEDLDKLLDILKGVDKE